MFWIRAAAGGDGVKLNGTAGSYGILGVARDPALQPGAAELRFLFQCTWIPAHLPLPGLAVW